MVDRNQVEASFTFNNQEMEQLAALSSVEDSKLREQALAQQWLSLKLRPMELLTAAMRSTKVQEYQNGTTLIAQLVHRAQEIAVRTDEDEDSEDTVEKVLKDVCTLLAKADDTDFPLPPSTTQAQAASFLESLPPPAPVSKVPTKFTKGLTVRPSEAIAKYTTVRERMHVQGGSPGDSDSSDGEDNEDKDSKDKSTKSKKRSLHMIDELRLLTPSDPGQSMPIIDTSDAVEVKVLKTAQLKRAQRSFPKVVGLPVAPKSFPLLETLKAAGFPAAKIENIRPGLAVRRTRTVSHQTCKMRTLSCIF
jgi:hypothetical protein